MRVLVKLNEQITVEIEETDTKEALYKAVNLTGNWCHNCDEVRKDFRFIANRAKSEKGTFTYIKRICKCKAVSTLGQHKTENGGGYFWKKFELYISDERLDRTVKESLGAPPGFEEVPPSREGDSSDLPF